jgi:6-phosphofructokinase 1
MVCLQQEQIRAVAIADAVGKMKTVDPAGEIVRAARAIGISFGD